MIIQCLISHNTIEINAMISNVELDESLKRLFESDEENETLSSDEEKYCEEHFQKNHKRRDDGKYVVTLPFKNKIESPELGNSRKIAMATLFQLEKKFEKQTQLFTMYKDFINEYIQMGHMSLVTQPSNDVSFYFPHHAVLRDSTTTKLRVVFNGSQKTSNGTSLNDHLASGSNYQCDMISLLLRWRKHKIAISGDIEKMYRMIMIDEKQRNLQKILWRENSKQKFVNILSILSHMEPVTLHILLFVHYSS